MVAIHSLPGRLRMPVDGLRGRPDRVPCLEQALLRLPGVCAASASAATGRVLVHYDPRRLTATHLARLLTRSAPPCPPPPTAADEVAATVDAAVVAAPVAPPETGLTTAEAARRLKLAGPNALAARSGPGFVQRLVDQFKDVMVFTLLGGAGISLLAGRVRDALIIAGIVGLNAVIGAAQAGKAEGALDALRRMSPPQATAMRDGRALSVPAVELVPGDLILLEAGDKVPADGRLVSGSGAQADESMLTGESLPVAKAPDQKLFAGTVLTSGRCAALVTATGMRTEMGRIARLLGETREGPTPLQSRMEGLGRTLVKGSLWVCGAVVLAGLLRGQPLVEMFMTGVSLAVAAIPEGLPTFVTLGLATGVRQMARRKALVRKLQAVETLGSATYICTDKTGTLTANTMTVREIYTGDRWYDVTGHGYTPTGQFRLNGQPIEPATDRDLHRLLSVCTVCNNAALERDGAVWRVRGDPTEGALLVAAAKAGLDPVSHCKGFRRIREVPFDADRRRMTVVCAVRNGVGIYTKGAPEAVLEVCTHIAREGRLVRLTQGDRRQILAAADGMAGKAYRVLATAYRSLKAPVAPDDVEAGLVFLGLLGMMDPPRPEVPPALARCRRAGIQVLMLTGDHPRTAAAIAREIGLLGPGDLVMTGAQLSRLSDQALADCVERLRVGARVSPEQKLRVVRALRTRGHVVAMTGDGVNDAPAVKEADIGIAMGMAGTEVTKEAASLVLADDNFATIVAAVEQGRVTYNNIRKSIRYLLASNTGELVLMVAAMLLGLPLPLVPLQILWLNLLGDGLPALALGAEPGDGTEMERPPRPRRESLFAQGLGDQIVRHGIKMGLAALAIYAWALLSGKPLAVVRTLTLCALVLGQLVYLFRARGIAHSRRRPNRLVAWAAVSSLGLLAGSVLIAPLRRMLQLAPLGAGDWAAAGLAGAVGAL